MKQNTPPTVDQVKALVEHLRNPNANQTDRALVALVDLVTQAPAPAQDAPAPAQGDRNANK